MFTLNLPEILNALETENDGQKQMKLPNILAKVQLENCYG